MRFQSLTSQILRISPRPKFRNWLLVLTIGIVLGSGHLQSDRAAAAAAASKAPTATPTPASNAPAPLQQALTQIDAAANSKNLKAVLEFYGPNFTHSDGLTRQALEQALTALWKQYPNLTYRTELKSWQPIANGFQAETVTSITGTQTVDGQEVKLDAMLRAKQRFENQKIVQQEILSERNQITSGDKPPTVKVVLPEQVKAGQEFSFDAIVQEPLGADLLLGTVVDEPVTSTGYLKPATADLQLLTSGGLFKVGKAPNKPSSQWISAVLVRNGGMTMVTQRLRIVAGNPARSMK
jgi:hypothetical protein